MIHGAEEAFGRREKAPCMSPIEERLARAEQTAALGRSHIARQRQIVADLGTGGDDARQARELLRIFEELQVQHEAHRDRLRAQVGAGD